MDLKNVDDAIRERKTAKVLGDPQAPLPVSAAFDQQIKALVDVAGHAPFHKEAAEKHRAEMTSAVPWRFYVLNGAACRSLLKQLQALGGSFMRGKIPLMLAAAGGMIQVTWLPDDDDMSSLRNQEHLMAASAATQNLLLAATARDIDNYWSSGGVLREPKLYEMLGIPEGELLVGSIFLFPEVPAELEVGKGKHRGKNNPAEGWSRWVDFSE